MFYKIVILILILVVRLLLLSVIKLWEIFKVLIILFIPLLSHFAKDSRWIISKERKMFTDLICLILSGIYKLKGNLQNWLISKIHPQRKILLIYTRVYHRKCHFKWI